MAFSAQFFKLNLDGENIRNSDTAIKIIKDKVQLIQYTRLWDMDKVYIKNAYNALEDNRLAVLNSFERKQLRQVEFYKDQHSNEAYNSKIDDPIFAKYKLNTIETNRKQYLRFLLYSLYIVELQRKIYYAEQNSATNNLNNEIKKLQNLIHTFCMVNHEQNERQSIVIKHLDHSFWEKMIAFLLIFPPYVGDAHVSRISLVFARIFIQEMLAFIKSCIKELGGSVDDMQSTLDKSRIYLNSLSVALPALRLILLTIPLVSLAIKAVINQNPKDYKRLSTYWENHYATIVNDILWAPVNFVTNFNTLCRISDGNANIIGLAFMVFDVLWLLPGFIIAYNQYLDNKLLLTQELIELNRAITHQFRNTNYQIDQQIILENLMQLQLKWETEWATNIFRIMGSALFALCMFIAVFVPPLALAACALSNLAMAMNTVGNEFSAFYEAREKLKLIENRQELQAHLEGDQIVFILHDLAYIAKEDKEIALLQKQHARNNLIMTLVFYTVMPTLIMSFAALSCGMGFMIPLMVIALCIGIAFKVVYPKVKGYQEDEVKRLQDKRDARLINVDELLPVAEAPKL